jgi:AcrR family transcriptional regulator
VAARAGVAKRTIYRWWPSKGALVVEAYLESVRRRHPDPDTGSVERDLADLLRGIFAGADQLAHQVVRGIRHDR